MAFSTLTVSDGIHYKNVPLGFSWTTFFFGPIPAFVRGDWMVAIILLVMCILTFNVAGMIVAFFYNRVYLSSLFARGYKVVDCPVGVSTATVCKYLGVKSLPS